MERLFDELCREIASYLDVLDLLAISEMNKHWNKISNDQIKVIQKTNPYYNYLTFKDSVKYDTVKKKCMRIAGNRNNRRGGILIIGGTFNTISDDIVYIRDDPKTLQGCIFEDFEDNSSDLLGSVGAAVNNEGKLFVIGGWDDSDEVAVQSVRSLDINNIEDGWTYYNDFLLPSCFSSASTTAKGDLLLFGGGDSPYRGANIYRESWIYRNNNDSWENIASMIYPRCGHNSVTLLNNQILVSGGYGGGMTYYNSAEVWDCESNRWFSIAPMNEERSGLAMVLGPGGAIYVTGGSRDGSSGSQTLERYDPREGTWSLLAGSMQCGRGYTSGAVGASDLFYVCGGIQHDKIQGGMECYDFRAGEWFVLPGSSTIGISNEYEDILDFPPEFSLSNEPRNLELEKMLLRSCHHMHYIA